MLYKNLILVVSFFLFSVPVLAFPPDSLGVKIEGNRKFILHEVEKSQGLFSISRRYNVPVADITEANPEMKEMLQPGDIIMVPMQPMSRFDRIVKDYPADKLVIHEVQPEETLFSISRAYEKPIDQIVYWNEIQNNNIRIGQKLIIDGPFIVAEANEKVADSIAVAEVVPNIIPVGTYQQQFNDFAKMAGQKNGEKWKTQTEKGMGGWIDEGSVISDKYLALHATAAPGTVMKVTNSMSGKTVYVKVIANLPAADVAQNMSIKLTKSAARELGVIDNVFRAEMEYMVKGK